MFTTFSSSGTHRWLRSLCSALAQLVLLMSNFSLYLKPATTYRDTRKKVGGKETGFSPPDTPPTSPLLVSASPYLSGGVLDIVEGEQVSRVGHGVILVDGGRERAPEVL